MHILSIGYAHSSGYDDPDEWLERIGFYTGILQSLARNNVVSSIEQINYNGKLNRDGVMYHFVNSAEHTFNATTMLNRYAKELQPDVILVNGLIFPMQVIQLRWMLGKGPSIFILHRAEKPSTGIRKRMQALADRFVDGYFFISKEMAEPWLNHRIIGSDKKIVEVVDASSVFKMCDKASCRELTGAIGDPVYLWVGRLERNKDPLTVVNGFLRFVKSYPRAKLYMIYQDEGLLSEVRNIVNRNEMGSESVVLLGRKDKRELELWYNSADFLISGSHYEGSGIAVIESMSCGCIPVLTNIDSFRKLTGDGTCGIHYEKGNIESLESALLNTASMDRDIESRKVLERFEREFSFDAIANKIEATITVTKVTTD